MSKHLVVWLPRLLVLALRDTDFQGTAQMFEDKVLQLS